VGGVFNILKSCLIKADFISGNSQKSFVAKSGEKGGCSISAIHFFFLGQKLLDKEHLVSWSIVIVENPIVEPNFKPFSILVDCLALRNEFKVNNSLEIRESDEHFLHL